MTPPFPVRLLTRCVAAACVTLVLGLLVPRAGAQGVRVGVRAGPTFGFLNDSAVPFVSADGDVTANTNVRLDLHAGGYAILPISGPYGLQTELLYVRKGGHFSRFGEQSYRVERYRLAYVQGQVLGRRDISLPGPLHLHVVGGLTVERFVNGAVAQAVHTKVQVYRETIDLTVPTLVQRWDVGALVGVGLGYPVGGAGRISLDLRYNPGFRAVFAEGTRPPGEQMVDFADPPPLSPSPPALRHDVITASLSFTTSLGR